MRRTGLGLTAQQAVTMVKTIVEQRKISLRRVCRVGGQRRATVYAKPKPKNEDVLIGEQLKDLSMKYLNRSGGPVGLCFNVWLATAGGPYVESQASLSSLHEPKTELTYAHQT